MSHWYDFLSRVFRADPLLLGNRYIELFLKSTECKPPQGIGSNGQYLFMLQMRGLPFKVTGKDIYKVSSNDVILCYVIRYIITCYVKMNYVTRYVIIDYVICNISYVT